MCSRSRGFGPLRPNRLQWRKSTSGLRILHHGETNHTFPNEIVFFRCFMTWAILFVSQQTFLIVFINIQYSIHSAWKMVLSMRDFFGIYTCLILSNVVAVISKSDVSCLRLMKDSIHDPFGYLTTSWNFNLTGQGTVCAFLGIDCWNDYDNRVLNIKLVDMGLIGQFPRGIEYCTSLTGLDLSNNNLSGPIPSDILQELKYLTFLDLSFNQFSGTIPPEIARCQYLNVLKLNNNQLSGPIPSQIGLMDRLKGFDVSHNGLTGPLPIFSHTAFGADSFYGNPGLCGSPLNPCKGIGDDDPFVEVFFKGFGIGWAISFTLVAVIFSLFGIPNMPKVISMYKRSKGTEKNAIGGSEMIEPTMISKLEKYVTRISFQELANLTSNFCNKSVIGFGKNGIMYKAFTPNGCSLAIKKLYASRNSDDKLVAEVLSLGTQRHPNLLPLMAFCIKKGQRFLVYKYMQNGTLYNCLHQSRNEGRVIDWALIMKISIGIANGLAWLHHSSRVRILHGNLNSCCILLDHNFEPRISNFWKAKFMNRAGVGSSSSLISIFESLLPLNCYIEKDVYCFGLILLELITGRESHDADLAAKQLPNDLHGQGFDEMIAQYYGVAKDCVNPKAEQRPTMLEVYKRLEEIKLGFENAWGSEISILTD